MPKLTLGPNIMISKIDYRKIILEAQFSKTNYQNYFVKGTIYNQVKLTGIDVDIELQCSSFEQIFELERRVIQVQCTHCFLKLFLLLIRCQGCLSICLLR